MRKTDVLKVAPGCTPEGIGDDAFCGEDHGEEEPLGEVEDGNQAEEGDTVVAKYMKSPLVIAR